MSSKTCVPELDPRKLEQFVADHLHCVLFVMDPYDLHLDPLIKALVDDRTGKSPGVAVTWLAKPSASRHVDFTWAGSGYHSVFYQRGKIARVIVRTPPIVSLDDDHNIFIFKGGEVVKRLVDIPPSKSLIATVSDCVLDQKPAQ